MNLKRKPDEQGIKRRKRWASIKFILVTLANFIIVYIVWCNSAMTFTFFNQRQYKSDLYFMSKSGFSLDILAGYYDQIWAIISIVIASIICLIITIKLLRMNGTWISSLIISTALVVVTVNTYGAIMRIG